MSLTTTREFRWDDPGAPTLNGTVGSFYALLKACLVGSGGIAYGSGAQAKPAAGWSIEFDDPGSQKIVFRNSLAHGGSGCYLRVLDNGSSAGGARVARIDVYEAMTDIDTGTATAGGGWVWKARLADANPRAWTLHADERTVYGTQWVLDSTPQDFPTSGGSNASQMMAWAGGDYDPLVAGDPGVMCAASATENPLTSALAAVDSGLLTRRATAAGPYASSSFWVSRSPTLTSVASRVALVSPDQPQYPVGIGGSAGRMLPPDAITPLFLPALVLSDNALRGRARGLYVPCNDWANSGGAPVGSRFAATGVSAPLSLAALCGSSQTSATTSNVGRVFVARAESWDDV